MTLLGYSLRMSKVVSFNKDARALKQTVPDPDVACGVEPTEQDTGLFIEACVRGKGSDRLLFGDISVFAFADGLKFKISVPSFNALNEFLTRKFYADHDELKEIQEQIIRDGEICLWDCALDRDEIAAYGFIAVDDSTV
jgi:hypothetical protein